MNTLINRILHYNSHDSSRKHVSNRIEGTCQESGSKGKDAGSKWEGNRGIQELYTECRRFRLCISSCKFFCLSCKLCTQDARHPCKEQEGSKAKRKERVKSFFSFIFLTIMYIDLLDTYPYYAMFNLKEMYLSWL